MCAHYAALRDLSVRYRTKAHSWPSALAVALVTGGAQSIRDILSLCAPAHRQRTEALLTVVHCARSIDPCISGGPRGRGGRGGPRAGGRGGAGGAPRGPRRKAI